MALSEGEQRLLEQLEAALTADDPKLANALRGTGSRRLHHRRAALSGLGFLAGVALLIIGMELTPIVSVLGFVVMLASAVLGLTAWRRVGEARAHQPGPHPGTDGDFMDRLEERLRRRPEDGV